MATRDTRYLSPWWGPLVEVPGESFATPLVALGRCPWHFPGYDDRVRAPLAAVLEGWGVRVQRLVFVCDVHTAAVGDLLADVFRVFDNPTQGDVRLYRLCERCEKASVGIGELGRIDECPEHGASRRSRPACRGTRSPEDLQAPCFQWFTRARRRQKWGGRHGQSVQKWSSPERAL